MTNRRSFMLTLAAGSSVLCAATAQAQAKVDPGAPQAVALPKPNRNQASTSSALDAGTRTKWAV
jgi:hypothetical protein